MADWKQTLVKLAPTLASMLGGPLAGAGVAALSTALGLDDGSSEADIMKQIESGKMTSEQIGKIRELELKLQGEEKERGFRYSELEFKDRDSARQREVQTKDTTPRNLTYIIVLSFIGVVICTLAGITQVDSVLAGTLIGYLSAKCEQALAYYLGSTSGSQEKTRLLAAATPPNKQ